MLCTYELFNVFLILKRKYSSLCNFCGPEKCNVDYETPMRDSLDQCLLNKGGDIAITTLPYAIQFFRQSSNAQKYKYFCKDGTSSSAKVPCIWTSQLSDLIVAKR